METRENYINGKYIKSKSQLFFDVLSSRSEAIFDRYPCTTQGEVDVACSIAKEQSREWVKASETTRVQYFQKSAKIIDVRLKEIAKAISIETGKGIDESTEEANEALNIASQISKEESRILRKPKGLVAIVSPRGCSTVFSSFLSSAGVIIEGNTVILKPSKEATLSAQIASEIYHDSGVPPGVFNVIYGNSSTGYWLRNNSNVDYVLE